MQDWCTNYCKLSRIKSSRIFALQIKFTSQIFWKWVFYSSPQNESFKDLSTNQDLQVLKSGFVRFFGFVIFVEKDRNCVSSQIHEVFENASQVESTSQAFCIKCSKSSRAHMSRFVLTIWVKSKFLRISYMNLASLIVELVFPSLSLSSSQTQTHFTGVQEFRNFIMYCSHYICLLPCSSLSFIFLYGFSFPT
jgi:hypothetical protein